MAYSQILKRSKIGINNNHQAFCLVPEVTRENVLQQYVDEVLEEVLTNERREIMESAIVREIREVRRLWPQFGINVAGGLVGAFLFAALLATVAFIVFVDPSPFNSDIASRSN